MGDNGFTPLQHLDTYWAKREDLYEVAGVNGGKARTCWRLAHGATGLVSAGSRFSPQAKIVAHVAEALGIPSRLHVPAGPETPELLDARSHGAVIVSERPGYNTVIVSRAKADAAARGWTYIPFGMECGEAVEETRAQVCGIPSEVKRIVVPVGSGMSLAGILWGIVDINALDPQWNQGVPVPVLGVVVGANPEKRLCQYAPPDWRDMVDLVQSDYSYDEQVDAKAKWPWFDLDPHYEAKCVEFLQPGDLFWIVGNRVSP